MGDDGAVFDSGSGPVDTGSPPCPDEVHVWLCDLDDRAVDSADHHCLLSSAERERADRLRRPRDATRHRAAHLLKREILAAYLSMPPTDLRFGEGSHGKPYLASPAGKTELAFNLAHADGSMVLAVTSGSPVGVDLERVHGLPDLDGMLERCLGPDEIASFERSVPTDRRLEAFFRVWTRKEAWLKATGEGLSGGLDSVEVTVDPDSRPGLLYSEDSPRETVDGPWIRDLGLPDGWVGAVAGPGSPPRLLRCGRWTAADGVEPDALPRRNSSSIRPRPAATTDNR